MKVILVNGSPNKEGCTHTALSEAAESLQKNGAAAQIYWLGNKPISGCMACGVCRSKGDGCVVKDTVGEFAALAKGADGFVFGSPVHYASAAGALCSFMDRLFFAHSAEFRGKPAAAVVSCRRGGATAALDRINKYFAISQMPVVSSQYWNMVHGHTPDEVRQDLEGLQIMRTLGGNMAWLLKCIAAGKSAGINMPPPENRIVTSFIR